MEKRPKSKGIPFHFPKWFFLSTAFQSASWPEPVSKSRFSRKSWTNHPKSEISICNYMEIALRIQPPIPNSTPTTGLRKKSLFSKKRAKSEYIYILLFPIGIPCCYSLSLFVYTRPLYFLPSPSPPPLGEAAQVWATQEGPPQGHSLVKIANIGLDFIPKFIAPK